MPRPHPPACRRHAIALACEHAEPIAQIAADIGISESCLPAGSPGPTSPRGSGRDSPRAELVHLRRENRVRKMEKEILGKAAAFFANESHHRSR